MLFRSAYNEGTVIECVSGANDLAATGDYRHVGGIVGTNKGNVIKCTVTSVTLSSTGRYYTNGGGIAGYNSGTVADSIVEDCTINGTWDTKGGVIGWNDGNNTNNHYNGSDYNQTGN